MDTPHVLKNARILIIKIGTALVAQSDGNGIKAGWLEALAQDIREHLATKCKIIIVSSGAVALGRKAMNIPLGIAPQTIALEKKQAASAVGQYHLFHGYHEAFAKCGLPLAQVLLTMSETENRRMHLNARATLNALLDQGIIPVINENDTISTGEIRFGDNDRLAARVAQMTQADCVLLLSTTDGLYTANPDIDPGAVHIPLVERLSDEHTKMAGDAVPGLSTGGMKSKVDAALSATRSGIHMVIAKGVQNHALAHILTDKDTRTTLFLASSTHKSARKKWIQAHLRPKGRVFIDNGAQTALKSGKSLLPVGVRRIEGNFERGDVIEIRTLEGEKLGMGLSAYNTEDALKIMGHGSEEIGAIVGYTGRSELIHRNDLTLDIQDSSSKG
ncbi:MAG: glutamate 5-kinase [Alphaproteobacteria bacterium]|nr:glutamate 5-kinase [Alphaproteobacteria bacterium]